MAWIFQSQLATISDATLAGYVADSASAARAALKAVFLPRTGALNAATDQATPIYPNTRVDSYAGLQAAINAARVAGTELIIPPGTYYVSQGLTIQTAGGPPTSTSKVRIKGEGGVGSLFDATGFSAVTIRRLVATDTFTLFTMIGFGHELEGLTFDGERASAGTLLDVVQGFELRMTNVRVVNSLGIGANLNALSNAEIHHFNVDECGSTTLPAVRIGGNTTYGTTNTLRVYDMHIERSPGTHLDIATGATAATDKATAVEFFGLHVEAAIDGTALAYATKPIIDIGNVQGLRFIGGFIYGAAVGSTLVRHKRQIAFNGAGDLYSGVTFVGTTLLGHTTLAGVPDRLIDLETGNGFTMIGCSLTAALTELIRVQSSYGDDVNLALNNFPAPRVSTTSTLINDARTSTVRSPLLVGPTLDLLPRADRPAIRGGGSSLGLTLFSAKGTGNKGIVEVKDNETDAGITVWFDTATKRMYLSNATAAPGSNPTSGLFLYVDPTTNKLSARDAAGFLGQYAVSIQGSLVWDAPSVATGGYTSTTATVTGAVLGDRVLVSPAVDPGDGVEVYATVSAANTVRITVKNHTAGAVDLSSRTYNIQIIR